MPAVGPALALTKGKSRQARCRESEIAMRLRKWNQVILPALALIFALAAPSLVRAETGTPAAQSAQSFENGRSYGYVRTLEGEATLLHSPVEGAKSLSLNQPIMVGDEVAVGPGSRLELALPDRTVLRLAGGSQVRLDHLAFSADSSDRTTLLRLMAGEAQMVVPSSSLGDELPRIDTANATVYIEQPGSYRIGVSSNAQTEVVVREGYAEVLTPDGSAIVRDDEEAWVEGANNVRVALRQAGAFDRLEDWGTQLDQQAQVATTPYVSPALGYESSSLAGAGSWVSVSGRNAWRPYVPSGWRPYQDGRWLYTPSGWTWVAAQPWGWITGHYGSWDYAPEYGWLWYPGSVYSPAWVYWYWGSNYVGWCPIGVYANYYSPLMDWNEGVFWVLYGGVRAPWDYDDVYWTYSRCGDFSGHHHHYWSSPQLRRNYEGKAVPRGILTTNTRGVLPRDLGRPGGALRALATRPHRGGGSASGTKVPDLTAFVARRPDLPLAVRQAIRSNRPALGLATGGSGGSAVRTVDSAPGRPHGAPVVEPRVPNPRVPDPGLPPVPSAWRSRIAGEPGVTAPAVRPNDWRTAGHTAPVERPSAAARTRAVAPRGANPAPAAGNWRSLGSREPVKVRTGHGSTAASPGRGFASATQGWRLGRPAGATTSRSVPGGSRVIPPQNLQGWHGERSYILHGPTVYRAPRPTTGSASTVRAPQIPVVRRVIDGVRGLSRSMSAPYARPSSPSRQPSGSRYSAPRSYRAPVSRGRPSGGGRSMSRAPSHSGGGAARTRHSSGGSHPH